MGSRSSPIHTTGCATLVAAVSLVSIGIPAAANDLMALEMCRMGAPGGDYDPLDDKWHWTCGNFPWTDNAYSVDCTGYRTSAVFTGTDPTGPNACLHAGERIRVNAGPDIIVATWNTKLGGKVYLPSGIYVDRGCGADPDGNGLSCPVLNDGPRGELAHYVRKISAYKGVEIVGEAMDLDGPITNGRIGTWLVSDTGVHPSHTDGDWQAGDTDPNGDGSLLSRWAFRVGLDRNNQNECRGPSWDLETSSLACDQDRQIRSNGLGPQSIPITDWGVFSELEGPSDVNRALLCLRDATSGPGTSICEGAPKVKCTVDSACNFASSGGPDLGPCLPFTEMISQEIEAGEDVHLLVSVAHCDLDDTSCAVGNIGGSSAVVVKVNRVLEEPCGTSGFGRAVTVSTVDEPGAIWPFDREQLLHDQSTIAVWKVWEEMWRNSTGGFRRINFMPNHWFGEDFSEIPGNPDCRDLSVRAASSGCDTGGELALGASFGGAFDQVTLWRASASRNSSIDGSPGGFQVELKNSLIADGRPAFKRLADATGGTIYRNNVWEYNRANPAWDNDASAALIHVFSNDFQMIGDTFIGNVFPTIFASLSRGKNTVIRDVRLIGNSAPRGAFLFNTGENHIIENVTLQSHYGRFLSILPLRGVSGNNGVSKMIVRGIRAIGVHNVGPGVGSQDVSVGRSFISITDANNRTDANGVLEDFLIQDIAIETNQPDPCIVWFDGNVHDTDRNATQHRANTSLYNLSMRSPAGAPGRAVCVGPIDDRTNGSCGGVADGCDALDSQEILESRFKPRMVNLRVNGDAGPEFSTRQVSFADLGRCSEGTIGETAQVVDAAEAGSCTGGGTASACCECQIVGGVAAWAGCVAGGAWSNSPNHGNPVKAAETRALLDGSVAHLIEISAQVGQVRATGQDTGRLSEALALRDLEAWIDDPRERSYPGRWKVTPASLLERVACETDRGSLDLDLAISGESVLVGPLRCDATGNALGEIAQVEIPAQSAIDLSIASVSGEPEQASVHLVVRVVTPPKPKGSCGLGAETAPPLAGWWALRRRRKRRQHGERTSADGKRSRAAG